MCHGVALFHPVAHLLYPLSELLFPRLCVVCGNCLVESERYICSACLADLPVVENSRDAGKNILDIFPLPFRPCRFYSLFYYNKYSDYRQLIFAVKYRSRKKLGVYLGRMLGACIPADAGIDGIVPVPLHPLREKERGFNQAFQIALGIREVTGLEIYSDVLVRIKDNVSQTGKTSGERKENVENIFKLHDPVKVMGKHILLVDDVMTTGATLGACMLALRRAENVSFSLACVAQAADF